MNGITNHPLMQALGLAVLHSVWQGILLFCILKMILSFIPERRSVPRYRILYGALTILTGLFCYSFFAEWQHSVAVWKSSGLTAATPQPVTAVISASWQDNLFISYANAFRKYTPVLALLYTAGLILLCFKMLREMLQVKYLRREVMLPEAFLEQQFITLKEQTGIRRNVLLRLSAKVQVPMMLGHLKPVILLPLALVSRLDTQQVEAVLLHELAHIKRHDYFWNILQMVMETLLFFNPVAWWLSALIRDEREHCCDDYVLRNTQSSLPYAHALLALEEYRIARYTATMALSGNKKNTLLNRIKRITVMKQDKRNTQKMLATVTVLVLLAATVCFATAFGQEKKEEPKTITKSYTNRVVTITDDKGNTKVYKDENVDPAVIEEAMKNVPEAMKLAGEAIKDVDWSLVNKSVDMAMAQANTAMKQVDWDEINATVKDAMKSVDWDEIHNSVNQAMEEAKASMKDVDWQEINKEMAATKEEMAKAQAEMKNVDWVEIDKSMAQAKEEMKKASVEMKKAMKEIKDSYKAEMKKAKAERKQATEDDVQVD